MKDRYLTPYSLSFARRGETYQSSKNRFGCSLFFTCFFCVLVNIQLAIAQVTPSPVSNYVVEQMPRTGLSTVSLSTPYTQVQTSVSYFDGLGRPLQTVQVRGAGDAANDVVTGAVAYDAYGRPQKAYVPVPGTGNAGQFTPNVQAQGTALYQNDQNPFAETVYEASPLNRPVQQFGPGQVWRNGAGRPQTVRYGVGAGIVKFKVFGLFDGAIYGNPDGVTNRREYFGATDIATQTLTDEQGKQTINYIDLQGRLIRHDVVLAPTDTLSTIYIYDNFERLTGILPPKLYRWFMAGPPDRSLAFFASGQDVPLFKETAYVYLYDKRGLVSSKHTPNAGWTDLIYDRLDRPVMMRDQQDKAESRWRFMTYDAFGRQVMTGRTNLVLADQDAVKVVQDAFRAKSTDTDEERSSVLLGYTNRSFPASVPISETAVLKVNYYDTAPANTTLTYIDSPLYGTVWNSTTGQLTGTKVRNLETGVWYDNRVWYDFKGRVLQQQKQNHLGDIDIIKNKYSFNGELLTTTINEEGILNNQTVGSNANVYYGYDHLSRPSSLTYEVVDGFPFEMARYQYDAIGRLSQKQIQPGGSYASQAGVNSLTLTTTPASNSVVQASQRIEILPSGFAIDYRANAGAVFDIALSSNTNTSGTTNALQLIDYQYHIRGMLQGVNAFNGRADLNAGQSDVFGYRLDYETAGRFDGNIGRQTWLHVREPGQPRSYSYAYDRADRLTAATYVGKSGESLSVPYIAYDPNGNITAMNRSNFDQLSYTYAQAGLGNRLLAVTDASSNTLGFVDGNTATDDYDHYPDGSLKKDLNRGIQQIKYNSLKLPQSMTFTSGKVVSYTYTATGEKLRMATSTGETRDYRTQTEYLNGQFVYQQTPEGRVVANGGNNGRYEYFHTDYLGNIRAVYYDSLVGSTHQVIVAQYQDYDPWGMGLPGLAGGNSTNRYKFNGKEATTEIGPNVLDFGARFYDASIGRMHTVDRAAEMFSHVSGYSFGLNNPIYNIDPTGDTTVPAGPDGKIANWGSFNTAVNDIGLDGVTIRPDFNGPRGFSADGGSGSSGGGAGNGDTWRSSINVRAALAQASFVERVAAYGPGIDAIEPDYPLENLYIGAKVFKPVGKWIAAGIGGIFAKKAAAQGGSNLALGLGDDLFSFAETKGFDTYRAFSTGFQKDKILQAMNSYDKIHFNVTGFGKYRFSKFDPSSPLTYHNYTNWEMHTIWSNPALLSKTTFYRSVGNGYEIIPNYSPFFK